MVFDRSAEVWPGIEETCDFFVVFYEEPDDCWQTNDRWGGLMTKSFNEGGISITSDDNSFFFERLSLPLKLRLSRLWWLTITFRRGTMNVICVWIGVVSVLFYLLMANKGREPTFWWNRFSHVWVSAPGITLITKFLSQYNPNLALKYDFSEKGHF